jgi:hypothetical protein
MYLLLAFLLVTFLIGGTTTAGRQLPRPIVVLGACVVVGIGFYSRRVL